MEQTAQQKCQHIFLFKIMVTYGACDIWCNLLVIEIGNSKLKQVFQFLPGFSS